MTTLQITTGADAGVPLEPHVRRCGLCLYFGPDVEGHGACLWLRSRSIGVLPMWLPPRHWVAAEGDATDCAAFLAA